MTPEESNRDLVNLSLALEECTGYDSIPTVENYYRHPDTDKIQCPWPNCLKTRSTALAMWRHIHFSSHHHRSFGVAWAETNWKARLRAIADGETPCSGWPGEPERSETPISGTPGTPKQPEEHTDGR